MNLSIVTINYNGSENTIKLLESLKNQTDRGFEVIVVDNNSEHGELQKLKNYRTEATNIVFIENDKNLGYSGGNNVGIRKALEKWEADPSTQLGASWVLLLNNDTWVKNDFISRLKSNLDPSAGSGQAPRKGIVGLAIDEGERTAYAGKIDWLKPTLIHITTLTTRRVVSPQVVHRFSHNDTPCRYYAIGGAVAIHKDVFDKVGFLDEKYFLYFEDADYSIRARKAGVSVEFLPEVKVRHSVSASTKKLGLPMILRYHYRNAFYFNLKNGPWHIKLLVWPWSWWIIKKQIIKIAVGKNREQSKEILAGVVDFYKNNYGKLHV